jgi:hypothetical protein
LEKHQVPGGQASGCLAQSGISKSSSPHRSSQTKIRAQLFGQSKTGASPPHPAPFGLEGHRTLKPAEQTQKSPKGLHNPVPSATIDGTSFRKRNDPASNSLLKSSCRQWWPFASTTGRCCLSAHSG